MTFAKQVLQDLKWEPCFDLTELAGFGTERIKNYADILFNPEVREDVKYFIKEDLAEAINDLHVCIKRLEAERWQYIQSQKDRQEGGAS